MSERSSEPPAISVVMPARNAAPYLTEALESLAAQTHKQWEAIVVDDGSTDDTAAIVDRCAAKDERIRLVQRPGRGVSAARNSGIEMARHEWLVFLDADDWLAPGHLARMAEVIAAEPDIGLVYCSWVRVLPAGRHGPVECGEPLADPLPELARTCRFAIHSCAVRRSLVCAVGGFDESLKTCEDWDLWIRVARTRSRFVHIPEVLAFYRLRPDSACGNAGDLLRDGIEVVRRAHRPDERVPTAPARSVGKPAFGLPAEELAKAEFALVAWAAGIAAGKGHDPMPLLKALEGTKAPGLSPWLTSALIPGLLLGLGTFEPEWPALWVRLAPLLERFLSELEAMSQAPKLCARGLRIIERRIVHGIDITKPITLGAVHAVRLDASNTIRDVPMPDGTDRLMCRVDCDGQRLGTIELPAFGTVAGKDIAAAVVQRFGRQLFRYRRPRTRLDVGLLLRAVPYVGSRRGLAAAAKIAASTGPGCRALAIAWRREVRNAIARDLGLARAAPPGESATAAIERVQAIMETERRKASEGIDVARGEACATATRRNFWVSTRRQADKAADRLPILMYHRIGADGPASLARLRVTPEAFARQLAYLREHGFHSIPLALWREAILSERPLRGRPVAITFDDGYVDVATCATTLLRRYGFSATVFVPSDFAGRAAEWDCDHGPPAPLLSWAQMRQLQADGLDFGAHSTAHQPLTALSVEEMLRDGVRAKATLELRLGRTITAIAYPHGDYDEVVNRLMEACGYSCGLTIDPRCSNIWDDPMCLPRIEIAGGDTLEDFAAKLAM